MANNLWAMTDDVQASRSRPRESKEYGPAADREQPPNRQRKEAAPGARKNCLDYSLLIGALLPPPPGGFWDILGHHGTFADAKP